MSVNEKIYVFQLVNEIKKYEKNRNYSPVYLIYGESSILVQYRFLNMKVKSAGGKMDSRAFANSGILAISVHVARNMAFDERSGRHTKNHQPARGEVGVGSGSFVASLALFARALMLACLITSVNEQPESDP